MLADSSRRIEGYGRGILSQTHDPFLCGSRMMARQKSSPVFRDEGRELVYVDFADPTLFSSAGCCWPMAPRNCCTQSPRPQSLSQLGPLTKV